MLLRKIIVGLARLLAIGVVIVFVASWVLSLGDAAAANRVYHRARIEHDAGRAATRDVCETSRRCCDAQCAIPFADQADACRRHLARLKALSGAPSAAASHDAEILKAYQDEAELWVERGRLDASPLESLRRVIRGAR